jgi:hypothetical protein
MRELDLLKVETQRNNYWTHRKLFAGSLSLGSSRGASEKLLRADTSDVCSNRDISISVTKAFGAPERYV